MTSFDPPLLALLTKKLRPRELIDLDQITQLSHTWPWMSRREDGSHGGTPKRKINLLVNRDII